MPDGEGAGDGVEDAERWTWRQGALRLHAGSLPLHHRDPFDRLLVAQAMLEKLTLLTADLELKPYKVKAIRAR